MVCALASALLTRSVGPISAMGALTVVLAVLLWGDWLRWTRHATGMGALAPVLMLAGWGALSMVARYHPTIDGLQNLLALGVFTGCVAVTAAQWHARRLDVAALGRGFRWAAFVAAGLFAARYASPHAREALGINPRAWSAAALVSVAWFLGRWRHGSRAALLAALCLLALIAISLSRTATGVGLMLFALSQARLRTLADWARTGLVAGLAVAAAFVGVTRVGAIRGRFLEGDLALSVGGVPINVAAARASGASSTPRSSSRRG